MGIEEWGGKSEILVQMGHHTKLEDRWCHWHCWLPWSASVLILRVVDIEVYEKFRLYWLGFCGKIANGLMVSVYCNMLENYSDACQMPEPRTSLRMCHHGKLSLTKVTERAAEGGTLNFRWFLLLVSVAKQWSKELTCQEKKSSEKTDLFWLGKVDNWAVTKGSCFLLLFFILWI